MSLSKYLPAFCFLEFPLYAFANFYTFLYATLPYPSNPSAADPDMQLRDHIQRIALQWPQYGYRRITAQLHRQGVEANHERVLRLMREDNLLCLRKRRFICTTDSSHSFSICPNLVPELTLSSINQLWVADITYIRLLREFVYLAVILDAFSRLLLVGGAGFGPVHFEQQTIRKR